MNRMTRKEFLQTVAGAAVMAAISPCMAAAPGTKGTIKLGVTLYSYTGEYAVTSTLEDCIADAAAAGAEGIDILSETHIPNYPRPSEEWIEYWHGLMRKYNTRAGCFVCRQDSRLRLAGQGSTDNLPQDIELAGRLGFKVLRPAWGQSSSDLRNTAAWRERAVKALRHGERHDVKLAPALQCPADLKSRLLETYLDLIAAERTDHLGLMIEMGPDGKWGAGRGYKPSTETSKALLQILPHTFHVCGKFLGPYVFDPGSKSWRLAEADAYASPVAGVVSLLRQGGYDGYLASEYEGPRNLLAASSQLHAQQFRLNRLLGRA